MKAARSTALVLALALVAACAARASSSPVADSSPPGGAPAPAAAAGKGSVQTIRFAAPSLGVDKEALVWLPASYASGSKRYPVVYLLHCLGCDEKSFVRMAGLAETADAIGLEAIVVMPDGDAHFYINSPMVVEYDACLKGRGVFGGPAPENFCVRTPRYEDYITQDLVAHVDGAFRTIAERGARGLAGFSMGGFGALMLSLRHPELFAAAASHAGVASLLYAGPWPYDAAQVKVTDDVANWGKGIGRMGEWMRGVFGPELATWRAHDPAVIAAGLRDGKLALYLDAGDADRFGLDAGARHLHDVLDKAGVKHTFAIVPGGGHDMEFVKGRLDDSLGWMAANLTAAR